MIVAPPIHPRARRRIVQVFNEYLKPGGEANSVARIADDLESAGHSVRRFWRSSKEWMGAGAPPRLMQPLRLWRNPAVLDELRRVHESHKADLWIFHNVVPVVSLGVYGLAKELGVPVFQWLHNYRPISPGGTLTAGRKQLAPEDPLRTLKEVVSGSWNGRLLTAWLTLAYAAVKWRGDFSAVRAWIAISEEMRNVFLRAGWPAMNLFALRHSWHIQQAAPSSIDEGYFLFLGRAVETKGVRFLLDLWKQPALAQARLVIAGQGPLVDELRSQSPGNVQWVGHVEGNQKTALLAGCRAVLFPALWAEPLGTVAYEGFEFGKPVLASRLGGLKELVTDGQTGRLLEPGDINAWRDAILGLDAATAQQWGHRGRLWLEENASPTAWNQQFDRIVEHALRR